MEKLSVIDLSDLYAADVQQRRRVGNDILKACHDFGFFYASNHGISSALVEACFRHSRDFFALPDAQKLALKASDSNMWRGYEQPNTQDSKEAFVFGVERGPDDPLVRAGIPYHGSNPWPELSGWRQDMLVLFNEFLQLSRSLNRAFALALDVPEDYFDRLSQDPMAAMRFLRYAPASDDRPGIEAHTDWGALSMLFQEDVPGLEILTPDDGWQVVEPVPGTCVINIGEMVARWTNDYLKATLHRVINRSDKDRYSMAFFLDMDHDAIIECLPAFSSPGNQPHYPPVPALTHIMERHRKDYGVS